MHCSSSGDLGRLGRMLDKMLKIKKVRRFPLAILIIYRYKKHLSPL
jgi:hypothetical protein